MLIFTCPHTRLSFYSLKSIVQAFILRLRLLYLFLGLRILHTYSLRSGISLYTDFESTRLNGLHARLYLIDFVALLLGQAIFFNDGGVQLIDLVGLHFEQAIFRASHSRPPLAGRCASVAGSMTAETTHRATGMSHIGHQ